MAFQLSAFLYLSILSFTALVFTPTSAMIGGTVFNGITRYLGTIHILNKNTGERTVMCTATMISPYKALTSCYCANYALFAALSNQNPYPFNGTVLFSIGMTSFYQRAYKKQMAAGLIYEKELSFSDIYCPAGVNVLDTTNFPDDIGVIDIGTVNIKKYGLKPIRLGSVVPSPGANNTYIGAWSSTTSCTDTVKVSRNSAPSTIVECGQTGIPLSECAQDELCTRYPAGVQLTQGDTGGQQYFTVGKTTGTGVKGTEQIQFAVVGRQRQTEPYGLGCTKRGQAQLSTKIAPYIDWIKKVAPFAKFYNKAS